MAKAQTTVAADWDIASWRDRIIPEPPDEASRLAILNRLPTYAVRDQDKRRLAVFLPAYFPSGYDVMKYLINHFKGHPESTPVEVWVSIEGLDREPLCMKGPPHNDVAAVHLRWSIDEDDDIPGTAPIAVVPLSWDLATIMWGSPLRIAQIFGPPFPEWPTRQEWLATGGERIAVRPDPAEPWIPPTQDDLIREAEESWFAVA